MAQHLHSQRQVKERQEEEITILQLGGLKKRRGGHRGGRGGWIPQNARGQANQNQQTKENIISPASEVNFETTSSVVNNQNTSDVPQIPPPQYSQTGEPRSYRNRRGNRGRGGQGYGRGQGFYGPKYGSRNNFTQPPNPSDEQHLKEQIVKQVDYYFSTENLCKDVFLRENMDKKEGWISIYFLMNFHRMKELVGTNKALFLDALKDSSVVEIKSELLRKTGDWAAWVLPPLADKESDGRSVVTEGTKGSV